MKDLVINFRTVLKLLCITEKYVTVVGHQSIIQPYLVWSEPLLVLNHMILEAVRIITEKIYAQDLAT